MNKLRIMCLPLLLFFFSVPPAVAQCKGAKPERSITYVVEPTVTPTSTALHIQLKFQGLLQGSEIIDIPTQWAGQTFHSVTNLRGGDGVTIDEGSGETPTIHYKPKQPITLSYDLVKDWDGPFHHPLEFHPVLLPSYFEINGENALVHPHFKQQSVVDVNFTWRKFPAGWALATSFGTQSSPQDFTVSHCGLWRDVDNALFTGGEFRIHHFEIDGHPSILAIRDNWTFTDEEAVAMIQKEIGMVRNFWQEHDFPYFLVTWKSFDRDNGSGDGTAFTNAFWIYLSHKDPLSFIVPTLAHETFHEWNPRRFGVDNESDSRINWFTEGFTQYYGFLLPQRAGMISLPDYVAGLNQDLLLFPTTTNPYVNGRIIALWLDGEIRKQSQNRNSLDTLMRCMLRDGDKPLTNARILDTIDSFLSAADRETLNQVFQGADVPPPDASVIGPCARATVEELPTFDLGFDFQASRSAGKVTNVSLAGPAYKAGLRNGQMLTNFSFHPDHPEEIAKFRVKTGDGEQSIEYLPQGKPVKVPQFHLDSSLLATAQTCAATH